MVESSRPVGIQPRFDDPAPTWPQTLTTSQPAASPCTSLFDMDTLMQAKEPQPGMRILVVDDDKRTASFIRKALQTDAYAVDVIHDGAEAVLALRPTAFDLVVLDIMLPGLDGLSVLQRWRAQGIRTPILLLTARGEVGDRVTGLDAGADDYLCKPFALDELLARVRALVRRGADSKPLILQVGDLTLNTATREVRRGAKEIELAPREYRLLEFLMQSRGRICGRMAIVEKVWDYDFDPGSNLVDVYIMRLREKLDNGFEPKLLHTVRGVGYSLKVPP